MLNSTKIRHTITKPCRKISRIYTSRKAISNTLTNSLSVYFLFLLFYFEDRPPATAVERSHAQHPIILAQAAGGPAGTPPGGTGGAAPADPGPATPGPAAPDPEPAAPDPEPAAPDPPAADPNAGLGSPGEGKIGGLRDLINAPDVGLSDRSTRAIVEDIAEIATTCESVPGEYRIDCLGKGFSLLAKSMPDKVEYETVRTEVAAAGKALRKIARDNQDRAKPRLRRTQKLTHVANARRSRAYRPIKEAALEQATEQAIKVITETQTRLLRSAEGSERRRVHYQSIARSVGSTTRILRS